MDYTHYAFVILTQRTQRRLAPVEFGLLKILRVNKYFVEEGLIDRTARVGTCVVFILQTDMHSVAPKKVQVSRTE